MTTVDVADLEAEVATLRTQVPAGATFAIVSYELGGDEVVVVLSRADTLTSLLVAIEADEPRDYVNCDLEAWGGPGITSQALGFAVRTA